MDQQRRLLVFGLVSFLTFYGWLYLGPEFFPDMFPKPPVEVAQVDGVDPAPADGTAPGDGGEESSNDDSEPDIKMGRQLSQPSKVQSQKTVNQLTSQQNLMLQSCRTIPLRP